MQKTKASVDDKIKSIKRLNIDEIERDLWVTYWRKPSDESRDRLVEHYIPWLHTYALGKFVANLPSGVDTESIFQVGLIAVSDIIGKYDGSTKFTTYGLLRVRGAAADELRNVDPVPRLTRKRAKLRKQFEENGLDPEVYMSPEEFRDSVPLFVGSIDKVVYKSDFKSLTVGDFLLSKVDGSSIDKDDSFRDLCRGCTLEEQTLLYLYYVQNHTMGFIGLALNLSESRISQMHANILKRLQYKGRN